MCGQNFVCDDPKSTNPNSEWRSTPAPTTSTRSPPPPTHTHTHSGRATTRSTPLQIVARVVRTFRMPSLTPTARRRRSFATTIHHLRRTLPRLFLQIKTNSGAGRAVAHPALAQASQGATACTCDCAWSRQRRRSLTGCAAVRVLACRCDTGDCGSKTCVGPGTASPTPGTLFEYTGPLGTSSLAVPGGWVLPTGVLTGMPSRAWLRYLA
jgi:hypothetical protein